MSIGFPGSGASVGQPAELGAGEAPYGRLGISARERFLRASRAVAALTFCSLMCFDGAHLDSIAPRCVVGAPLVFAFMLAFVAPRMTARAPLSIALALAAPVALLNQSSWASEYLFPHHWYGMGEPLATRVETVALLVVALGIDWRRARLTRAARPTRGATRFVAWVGPAVVALIALLVFVEIRLDRGHSNMEEFTAALTLALYLAAATFMLQAGAAARRVARGRRSMRWAVAGVLVFPCCAAYGLWIELRQPTPIPPTPITEAATVFQHLRDEYPHWDSAQIEPQQLWKKHRRALADAAVICRKFEGRCKLHLLILRGMLAELQNGHTKVLLDGAPTMPLLSVELIEGQAVVTKVCEASDAEEAEVTQGSIVLAVDDKSVAEALKRAPSWMTARAAPETRLRASYRALLAGDHESPVSVVVQTPGATPRRVVLSRTAGQGCPGEGEGDYSQVGYPRIDEDGLGYLAVRSFHWRDRGRKYLRAMKRVADAKGLILDLRDNEGGFVHESVIALGPFFDESVDLGEDCPPVPTEEEGPAPDCTRLWVEPWESQYTGPVAVLLNDETFSAAEIFAFGLCGTGRARCFGRTTAGETDIVVGWELEDGLAQWSMKDFRPAFGESLLGIGVKPHERVEWTIDDVRSGRDPDFEAAKAWLRGQIAGTSESAAVR